MKVKELIKMLEKLEQDKEIFIYQDWDYLHEEWTYFKLVENLEDFRTYTGYYLKAGAYTVFEQNYVDYNWDEVREDVRKSRRIAVKYMKNEWYPKVNSEGVWYLLAF